MKIRSVLLGTLFLFICNFANAQATVNVTVNNANITTTCTDIFGQPDPLFQVNIQGQGNTTYPQNGACFTALPNVQYSESYNCGQDAPLILNVCFKVFENDGFGGCNISEDCTEEICQNFPLPMDGNEDYTLALPGGGDSGGTLDFTIDIIGAPLNNANDEICGAIDLGVLTQGTTLGDAASGAYNNFCATQFNDLDPCDFSGGGSQCNVNGVWFSFTTDANPISQAQITALSDPLNVGNTGNGFLIQMAIFEALDGACDGSFELIENLASFAEADEVYSLSCLSPNTTYYIMIDGAEIGGYANTANFGLEVSSPNYTEAADEICNAFDMGTIPLDGLANLPNPMGNQCAINNGDPNTNWGSQNSVWFTFSPSATGHVLIEAESLPEDPISLQLAVFQAFNNNCNGPYLLVESVWDNSTFDETLELSCLDPDLTYFVVIDGEAFNGPGFFDLTISDAGNNTPEETNVSVLCAGGTVSVGAMVYNVTGNYSDTLPTGGGCFEIINTDLTVLVELIADLTIISSATGEDEPDGEVTITAVGGTGNYTYNWSNTLTIPNPTNLLGGQNYCVTVSDDNGCEDILCFDMPYIDVIFPTVTDGSVLCNGDNNGTVSFFVENGFPPYTYQWADASNTLNGNGVIADENIIVFLNDLPAGVYDITVTDNVMDTIFTANVTEPDELIINNLGQIEVSCFDACDGGISIEIQGGIPPYIFTWSNGNTGNNPQDLCNGVYEITVSDFNDCQTIGTYIITQPDEFIATTSVVQNVTCFQGTDGSATVSTNGNPTTWLWSTGDNTETIDNQVAGDYSVTVTNEDGCEDIAIISIAEPDAPVTVTLEIIEVIICNGAADAVIRSNVTGPGDTFTYIWSNGNTAGTAESLTAGTYSVTVENEVGCVANAEITVTEPDEIEALFRTEDVNCADGEFSGKLFIDQVTGGEEPYLYSVDGLTFVDMDTIADLSAGPYTFYVEDALGCVKTYDFAILPPPTLVVDLGETQTIFLGETIEIIPVSNSQDVVYEWISSELLPENCILGDCENLEITPIRNTLYTVMATDTITQCTAEAQVEIMVNKARFVYFPDAFSPNDDGYNDKYLMYGQRGVQQVKSFRIFERNGGLMYQNADFMPSDDSMGWDGYFGGKLMNIGVYVYVAEIIFIDGETEIYSGSVTLIR
ncbi:MAG: gliding motility-associated-like protein [Saprospiraceae bacterium]|jgi:gliding motility-associated-like protein